MTENEKFLKTIQDKKVIFVSFKMNLVSNESMDYFTPSDTLINDEIIKGVMSTDCGKSYDYFMNIYDLQANEITVMTR